MRNGFPGIIGAVDGTQIAIVAPSVNDENGPPLLFYNRKGYYSLNVQIVILSSSYSHNIEYKNNFAFRYVIQN